MTGRNEWESFFDAHAPEYMENVFVKATAAEVDFMLEQFGLEAGARIVDVGCGTGRHSVELARRGHRIVGLDISNGMLEQARKALDSASADIEPAGGSVTFVKADATSFANDPGFRRASGGKPFDAAICICEGGFGLLGPSEPRGHDIAILMNVAEVLGPGAPFLMTALNALRITRLSTPETIASGRWDPVTLTERHDIGAELLRDGRSLVVVERWFTAPELRLMHSVAGLEVQHVWGGTAGNWGRRPIDPDEYEVMVVSRKKA